MQDSAFEKKVQEQMQGFNLEPSPGVWAGVEERIQKKKKRRFIVWWFVLAALLLGGGAAYFLQDKKESSGNEMAATSNSIENIKRPEEKQVDSPLFQQETKKIAANKIDDSLTAAKPNSVPSQKQEDATARKQINTVSQTAKRGNDVQKTGGAEFITYNSKAKKRKIAEEEKEIFPMIGFDDEVGNTPDANSSSVKKADIAVQAAASSQIAANETVPQPNPDSAGGITKTAKTEQPVLSDSISSKETTTKTKKTQRKWERGISLFAGQSNLGNGLSLFKNSNEDAFSSLNNAPPQLAAYISPRYKGAFSFQAEVFAKRKLSDKVNFYAGVSYAYLSTRLLTGKRVDTLPAAAIGTGQFSNSDGYYQLVNSSSGQYYTNHYHYLKATTGIAWRIINGKKFKLYWDNSIGYGRLLGTNMLHYSSSLPGYYQNDDLLARNQLVFTSGFTIPLSERMELNPSLSFAPSSLYKQGSGSKQYFTQFGIRLRYFVKK